MRFVSELVRTLARNQLPRGSDWSRIVANAGWLLFDRIARALLGLMVGAWVARHLGPSQFGLLTFVASYVAMFLTFATLGTEAIIVRDVARDPGNAEAILGSALALRVAAGIICWVGAVLGVAMFGDHQDTSTVALTAVVGGILAFQAGDVIDLWFQSQSKSRLTVIAKLCSYLVASAIRVLLILTDAPLLAFAAVTALDACGSVVALAITYRHLRTNHAWKVVRKTVRTILRESWPFMLSGFAIMVYMRIDQLLINRILGSEQLGIYAAALPLSQLWQIVPVTIATSIAPMLSRTRVSDPDLYQRLIVLTFRLFFYYGVLSVILTYLTSEFIVYQLFGSRFSAAAAVLDIYSLSNVFCFLGIAHNLWLVNENRFAVRLYGTILAGCVTIFINILLLPRIGLLAACYAAILSQAIAAFIINYFLDRASFRLQCSAILFTRT